LLFEELVEDYLEYSRRSKRSSADHMPRARRLLVLWKDRLAMDLTSKDVEGLKASLAETLTKGRKRSLEADNKRKPQALQPLSPATVNHHLKLLKAVYNRAIRAGRLTYNPVAAVNLLHEHNARNRCLSLEEENRLLNALPARLRSFVVVALHTGMRRG